MLGRSIFYKTIGIILTIWLVFFLGELGLYQKCYLSTNVNNGIHTILTGPLLHANLGHIIGNTRILILTIPLVLYFYKKDFLKISVLGYIIPSYFLYIFQFNVIGISGLTYTYIWFLIFSGIGSKDQKRFICSIFLIVFYSGSMVGFTPLAGIGISWQAHLLGMIVALCYSVYRYFRIKG